MVFVSEGRPIYPERVLTCLLERADNLRMTYAEAIAHFGTQVRLARALGITQPTVSCWGKRIPPSYQYQLEVITNRALQADAALRQPRSDKSIYQFQ